RPYYYDKDGNYQEAEWEVQENKLILNIKTEKDRYPLSVDPTLAFTAPGVSNGGVGIEGGGTDGSSNFGYRLTVGDLNADGKTDLVVSAPYLTSHLYIFYNDGAYASRSSGADVVISEEGGGDELGAQIAVGDFNADGKKDLAVGAPLYSTTGRVYIFYNDGTYPAVASGADVKIDGEEAAGGSLAAGDLNADGKTDLIVGDLSHNSSTGRVYVLYNDGTYPSAMASADVIINGQTTSDAFATGTTVGDLNADGKIDLVVGSTEYATQTGRVYIFYADGTNNYGTATCSGTPAICSANNADVFVTGVGTGSYFSGYFTFSEGITIADLNADGRNDLAVGAANSNAVYIFYGGSIITETATGADVTIVGDIGPDFGLSIESGDVNGDSKADLIVASYSENYGPGAVYVFYNDGSYPASSSGADVLINGDGSAQYGNFGSSLAMGDMNSDGKEDLIVGAQNYNGNYAGKTYIFYSQNGILSTNRSIAGEAGSGLGSALVAGDFNADGRVDLAVGANTYSSNAGRTYIFYNDGSVPTTAATADVIITGETSSYFGTSLAKGDLNADGEVDLIVGASIYTSNTGRAYIFYNDGSIPTTAAKADVIITGESTGNYFGTALTTGDFNADGETDLAATAFLYGGTTGRAYIFYNDGSIPTTAATADVIITGQTTSDQFGSVLVTGDLNADGETDLIISSIAYSADTGRVYIFHNDGSIPTTAATADVMITGDSTDIAVGTRLLVADINSDSKQDLIVGMYEYSGLNNTIYIFYNGSITTENASGADVSILSGSGEGLGSSLIAGDFNSDGRMDLAAGAALFSSGTGKAYIFYNDGSIPTTSATADVTIVGESGSNFGQTLAAADFNSDGKTDLVVGGYGYSSSTGRIYVFYNDGSIPTTIATADVIMTGDATSDSFGRSLTTGDFNSDGKADLVVGASGHSTNTGRVYFYEGQDNYSWTLQQQPLGTTRVSPQVTGEELQITSNNAGFQFGTGMVMGDFNADGKKDLAVTSNDDNTANNVNSVYIFYNDGNYPAGSSSADVVITLASENIVNEFAPIAAADLNSDGKTDLIASSPFAGSTLGAVYIFYNDGSYPASYTGADVTIAGSGSHNNAGIALETGDFNADGKEDLAVGAAAQSSTSFTGHVYLFYNDGSYPSSVTSADVDIAGETTGTYFGLQLQKGDLNADGKVDLVVGASVIDKIYIFYNDGDYPSGSSSADVIVSGDSSTYFGQSLAVGDVNIDGRIDLAVSARNYGGSTGRAYIFYNDGSIPTTAATADVVISGQGGNFGWTIGTADLNADGLVDLMVGAIGYSSNDGRAYIFYNNGAIPATIAATAADVIIQGQNNSLFGLDFISGDFNADGRIDLVISATAALSGAGRTYIFYNDGSYPTTAATADVFIDGQATSSFGSSLAAGDLNADGEIDLVVSATSYSPGRTYIFYNDGTIPTTAATADVIISGETSSDFGGYLITGDFNADGKADLAAASYQYSSSIGRTYIFYNDGSIPTTAATADVIITGETTSNYFGTSFATGDLNTDGKTDLVTSAYGYSTNTGRAYIFYNDGSIPTTAATADVIITGETSTDKFGSSFSIGDLNADGEVDLAAGAYNYSSGTGRAYIFYSDGSIPTTAATADVKINGEEFGSYGESFSQSLVVGDLNADSKIDLAVGSPWAGATASGKGRVYIFYNDGSYPTTAATADVIIEGASSDDTFGSAVGVNDLNADGKVDLLSGAYWYPSSNTQGRVYIFYNDGSYPSTVAGSDKIYTGITSGDSFGGGDGYSGIDAFVTVDWNNDGIKDLLVGAPGYSGYNYDGVVYTFITEVATTQLETKAAEFKGSSGVIKGSFELK
ncbi:MAG: FG-GAP-like repeat-containing protein, partial [Candidatus Moranbacteria bacterium]|nr:FG-GAP-like repeat-containing protein [Candidatus Moranbacteria bacterium]